MTVNPPEQDQAQSSGRGAQQVSAPRFSRLRRVVRVLTWPVRAFLSLLRRFWLLLLLLAGIAAFGFYVVLPRVQQDEAVTVPPQPVEAVHQDLLVTVPATGTLDFGTIVEVGFANAGVLTDLGVTLGDTVAAGDILGTQEADDLMRDIDDAVSALRRAELDLAEFLEDLEPDPDVHALRQAKLDLEEARAALEDLRIPPDAASIASADASVASARAQVASARAQVTSARAQVISAGAQVISARAQVTSALDSLDQLLADATDTEIADAASSVTSAEASLVSARGALADLLAGSAELEVRKAGDNVVAAQEATVAARRDLDAAVADHPSALADAEARLATAKSAVIAATVELHDLRVKPTPEAVRDADLTLEQARLTHDDIVRTGNNASSAAKEGAGVAYYEAQLAHLAALEPASPEELAEAESNLAAAEANLVVAQADRDDLATGPDLDALNEALVAAERNEVTAAAELDDLLAGPSATDLATRRSNIAAAQSSLALARAKLADLSADVDAGDVRAAEEDVRVVEENVTSALASLADADAKLADLLAGVDASDLRKAELAITRAEINLADLRADTEPDPDPLAVERLELAVADARRDLENARTALADATLVSPTAGVVLTVDANVGERVSDAFITLGVFDSLRVRINVDENDIGMLEVGQPADLTFAALDDREYKGKVAWIAVQGVVDQGLVTFPVDISLDAPDEHLRAGLTADVEILVDEARNVIVVPKAAVQTTPRGGVVFVAAADGSASRRIVQTGLSNRLLVEVVSGLEAGERVMPNAAQAQAEARAAAQAAAAAGGGQTGRAGQFGGQGGQAGAGAPAGGAQPATGGAQPAASGAAANLQGSQGGPPAGLQGRTPPPGVQPGQFQGQRGQGGQGGQRAGAGAGGGGGG